MNDACEKQRTVNDALVSLEEKLKELRDVKEFSNELVTKFKKQSGDPMNELKTAAPPRVTVTLANSIDDLIEDLTRSMDQIKNNISYIFNLMG